MALNDRRFLRVVSLVLVVGLVVGCGGKEERKAKYLEKAKTYLAEKNYDKARIEFKNVLQIDPKTAIAFYHLGQVEEAEQNWAKAFANYRKAVELDPELIEPRIRLARFYLAQHSVYSNRKDEKAAANVLGLAKEQADEILERDPGNLEGMAVQATLLALEGETDKAIAELEKINSRDPGLRPAAVLLATLYEQEKRGDDAEAVLLRAIDNNDDPAMLQLQLAQLYRKHEKNDKAEEVLRAVVQAYPDELGYRVSLASFLSQTGQFDKVEQVMWEAIEADPDDVQRYLLLTEFLTSKRDSETAIRELEGMVKRRPDLTDLRFSLARLYQDNGRTEEARELLEKLIAEQGVEPAGLKARVQLAQLINASEPDSPRITRLVEEVLAENPRDNDALLVRGRLAMQRKDYVGAINDFRSVLKDQPNSDEVIRLLASAHLANGERDLARDTLARGLEANPDNVQLRLSMAQLLMQGGDLDAALEQVDEVLRRDEAQKQALAVKYELFARKGDAAGLEKVAKQMQAAAPEEEGGYIGEARLRMAQKDYDAALTILDKVLAKNPESIAALLTKFDVLAEQKKFGEAIAIIDRVQKMQPDVADGYLRKGKLLQERGDAAAAIEQYEIALQKAPERSGILAALINLESRQKGGVDKAEKRLKAIVAENPGHRIANDLLGMLYMAKKAYPEAEQAFLRQLDINSDSDVVYSQLAQARMAQGNIQGAVEAFEQGLKVLPDSIRLLVGLASAHERRKDYEAAISLYERILEKQPDNAVGTNNLAALLVDYRTDPGSLEKAARLAKVLEKTDQPAFLDTAGWVHYRRGNYDKAIEILKGVVEQAPQVPVFQYHLGMAYLKKGDKAAAREHLSKAVGDEAKYDGVEEARAALAGL